MFDMPEKFTYTVIKLALANGVYSFKGIWVIYVVWLVSSN